MCRMWRFLAVLRSFFHSSLLCTFSCHPSPPTIRPSSLTLSCHLFVGLPLNLVFPKFIYNTLFGIPFSSILCTFPNQHNLFNLIVSIIVGFLTLNKFLYWLISSNFLFHCHILDLKFFYTLSFQKCSIAFYFSIYLVINKCTTAFIVCNLHCHYLHLFNFGYRHVWVCQYVNLRNVLPEYGLCIVLSLYGIRENYPSKPGLYFLQTF